jgi:hypothetical protein
MSAVSLKELHSRQLLQIQDPSYSSFGKKHGFFIQLTASCDNHCHTELAKTFGKEHYQSISSEYATVFISEPDLLDYMKVTNDNKRILTYSPMISDSKVSESASSGCHAFNKQSKENAENVTMKKAKSEQYIGKQQLTKPGIILVRTAAVSEDELFHLKALFKSIPESFHGDVEVDNADFMNMQANISNSVQFHVNGIDTTCEKTESLINHLASYRETLWVERRWEVNLFNRWAKPICQTGSGTNQAITVQGNLDGSGQVIACADTGLDMSSCYFKDSAKDPIYASLDVAKTDCVTGKSTPLCTSAVVDSAQRKVIQYITFKDPTDDGGGHGTHVSGTIAGLSSINYGDFVKYNGMSKNAKLSFYDIGDTSVGEGAITLPGNLNIDMFSVQYGSGARIFF